MGILAVALVAPILLPVAQIGARACDVDPDPAANPSTVARIGYAPTLCQFLWAEDLSSKINWRGRRAGFSVMRPG